MAEVGRKGKEKRLEQPLFRSTVSRERRTDSGRPNLKDGESMTGDGEQNAGR